VLQLLRESWSGVAGGIEEKRMKAKSLVILAGAVLVLGAFIWFIERHQPTSDEARIQEGRVFGSVEEEAVVALQITNNHGVFSFHRDDEGWRLTDPLDCDADPTAVNAALRALVQLKRDRILGPDEVEPGAYGLDHPEATVVLTLSDGQKHTLTIGNSTALDSNRAVSTDSENVILTGGTFFDSVNKTLDDWRSREVVDVTLNQMAAISVRTGTGTIEAAHLGDSWLLRSPVNDRADVDHLQNLIAGLNGLRVEAFTDSSVDLAAMGLDEPETTVLLVAANGSPGVTLEFAATREHGGSTQVACRRNGSDIFWVNDRALNALGKAAIRWRDPEVLAFDTWDVSALSLSEGSTSIRLSREDGLWRFDDGIEALSTEVQERLSLLAGLKAVDFDLMNLGTPEMGRVALSLDGDDTAIIVTFSEPLADGGNVLVTVSGRDTVMSVAPDSIQSITGNLQALRLKMSEETPNPDDEAGRL